MGCREDNQWGEKQVEVQNYKKDSINPVIFECSSTGMERRANEEIIKSGQAKRREVFLGDRMNRN